MSFLNVILLGGAAAFLAPLVIHLLNRSRFQSVDWGAMHLLEAAMQVNSRRLQWESWLLLLLRCLIPIILAICLARPVLTSLRVAGAGGKKSIVMLVDNSLSMQSVKNGPISAIAQAKEEVEAIVAHYRSAELGLWTMGGKPINALDGTTFDPERVRRKLVTVDARAGSTDIPASLVTGIGQLNSMSNPSKQLVLLSDFQASEWEGLSDADVDSLRGQLTTPNIPINLSFMRLGRGAAGTNIDNSNLSIRIRDGEATPLMIDDGTTIVGIVHNSGEQDKTEVRVNFSVDGRDLSSRVVSVPAGASQQVAFACEFATAGWHYAELEVQDIDGLPGDDRASYAVHVTEPMQILIVDPDGGRKIEHASGFLQLALAPFKADGLANAYRVQLEKGDQLRRESLAGFQALIFAGVPRLNDSAASAVEGFVADGGGLVVFAGSKLDARWYNSQWFDKSQLLPMKFGEERAAEDGMPEHLASEVIQTPWLDIFNGSEAGDLSSIEISRWLELQPLEAAGDAPLPDVLLRFSDEQPMLVSLSYGEGIVVQCATSCTDDWSNLPLRPAYVPLMQRIVALASSSSLVDANVTCGETINLRYEADEESDPPQLTIRGPGDNEVDWNTLDQTTLAFNRTELPGLYVVDGGESNASGTIQPQVFTVAVDTGESDLRPMNDAELKRIAQRLGAAIVDSAKDFREVDKRRSDGQEIWRWLLALLVVFLFGEILLGQRITKGATT